MSGLCEVRIFVLVEGERQALEGETMKIKPGIVRSGRPHLDVWVGDGSRVMMIDAEDLDRAVHAMRILAENTKFFTKPGHRQ